MASILKDMMRHPLNAIGGFLDAFRGWRSSRNWKVLTANIFSLLMVGTVCVATATFSSRRTDGQTNSTADKSQNICSTDKLELVSMQMHEKDFRKAIGFSSNIHSDLVPNLSDAEKQDVEFFSRLILAKEPTNLLAKYRIGMIHAINGDTAGAFREMQELASEKLSDFPPAHAWLAKAKLGQKASGVSIDSKELVVHLEMAKKWDKCDFRLPFYFP